MLPQPSGTKRRRLKLGPDSTVAATALPRCVSPETHGYAETCCSHAVAR